MTLAETAPRESTEATVEVIAGLQRRIRGYGNPSAMVAFSGGVDSATVLALSAGVLGSSAVTAVTAVSPSYPEGELERARAVAAQLGVEHHVITTREVERDAYARNDGERCFHCKTELYATIRRMAVDAPRGVVVMAGANADDVTDVRPGLRAGRDQGIRNPLLEEGVGKETVRAVARALALPVADKPALACLSSRVAFGIRITPELLRRVDRAEQQVRGLGFDQVRVRHLGDHASIEVPSSDVPLLLRHPRLSELRESLRSMGWLRIDVDPDGYRSGAMNATLVQLGRGRVRSAGS